MRRLGRITKNNVLFFNCDITQGMGSSLYSTWNIESVVNVAKIMGKIANVLQVPVLVSEHAPKAFGYTFPEIKDCLPKDTFLYEKTQFSMLTEQGKEFLRKYPQRKNILLYGMETHICIQQTCFQLIENGYNVHLIADGITSKRTIDRSCGLQRLINIGANLSTVESALYEMIEMKDPLFEEISKILNENERSKISQI